MRKNQWIFMGCALMCTLLVGCSKQADKSSTPAESSTAEVSEEVTEESTTEESTTEESTTETSQTEETTEDALPEEKTTAAPVSGAEEGIPEFPYQDYIQKASRETLLEETDLEEADLTENSMETGRYYLKDSVLIDGYSFTPYLLFSKSEDDNDMLYGSGYQASIDYDDAAVSELMDTLASELTAVYSDAITYEGLDSKFSDYMALSEEERAENGSYEEQWDAKGQENQYVYCSFGIADGKAVVEISSRITLAPDTKK